MIKKDHEEIWIWYKHIEAYHSSGMAQKEFCEAYDVDYKKFCNMRYRIDYKRDSDPDLYRKVTEIGRKYIASGEPAGKFAKSANLELRKLSEVVTHLGYLDIIEKLKNAKEEAPMKFIQVPNLPVSNGGGPIARQEDAEVIEKQNDIEIIISKGVKVSISPNIDSMKIIKIIELLKDL